METDQTGSLSFYRFTPKGNIPVRKGEIFKFSYQLSNRRQTAIILAGKYQTDAQATGEFWQAAELSKEDLVRVPSEERG